MQEAFVIVIFAVVIVASLVALATLACSRSGFDQIGANGLNDGSDRPASEPPSGAGLTTVRDEEARQMLEARSARRLRRGEEALDVERELARLIGAPAAAADPRLRSEVHELVMARNRRRVRQGKERSTSRRRSRGSSPSWRKPTTARFGPRSGGVIASPCRRTPTT